MFHWWHFELDNCERVTFKKGWITETHSINLDFVTKISELEEEAYKYLGFSEGVGMQHTQMK